MNRALGHNAVVHDSMQRAYGDMQYRAGCEVRPVCAPAECKPIYYISRRGHMFVCRPYKGAYIVYDILPRLNNGHILVYEMTTTCGTYKRVNIERLVYCTFVLGEYVSKLKIEFADRNKHNYSPENLRAKADKLDIACGLRMEDYASEYEKNRKRVIAQVSFKSNISIEDAADICEQAFIDMFAKKDDLRAQNFVGLWIYRAMQVATEFWDEKKRFVPFEDQEPMCGRYDVQPPLDVLHILKRPKERECIELHMQGASAAEIADETGLALSSVGGYLARARKRLRSYLLTDKELNKLYA